MTNRARPDEHLPLPATTPPSITQQDDRGVYGITIAADLVGMAVQTLRLCEARGLLQPERTAGGTRQYSVNDLNRLRRISRLQKRGVNLTGIAIVLDLQDQNHQLRAHD